MSHKCAAPILVVAAFSTLVALEAQVAGGSSRFDVAAHFSRDQQARLRAGTAVVSVPNADDGEVAMMGAVRTDVAAARLIEWSRQAHRLYSRAAAPAGARISNPPRSDDFNGVTLPAADIEALRKCEPGDCDLKLSDTEMSEIRRAINASGAGWKTAALTSYRSVLAARATAFLAKGLRGVAPTHDHGKPVEPWTELARLLERPERAAGAGLPIDAYLRAFPAEREDVESHLFWWKNTAASTRETIFLTHLAVFGRPGTSDVVVAESQVYASHYLDGSITYLMLTGDSPERYLVYLRRAKVDALRGLFGGIVRAVVERRVRNDGPKLITDLRRKLEGGPPPSSVVTPGR